MTQQRDSFTLYKKADIEGYLEKITPRWLSGKSRMWCELYGTLLYMFKDSKRSSAGSQQMDMAQVHMVRKCSSDKSGLQFEIISIDKQLTFSASSVDDCDKWIRLLQAAMTLKDQDSSPKPARMVVVSDYEDIAVPKALPPSTSRITVDAISTDDSGYCQVEFHTNSPPASPSSAATAVASDPVPDVGEDGYSTVEFRRKSGTDILPAAEKAATGSSGGSEGREGPLVKEGKDSAGYSTVELRKKSLPDLAQPEADPAQEDLYPYATVHKPGGATATLRRDDSAGSLPGSVDGSSDDDDQLISIAQGQHDPIPPLPYPLTLADSQPLEALREFLSSHKQLLRASFTDRAASDDPVQDLKTALLELNLSSNTLNLQI